MFRLLVLLFLIILIIWIVKKVSRGNYLFQIYIKKNIISSGTIPGRHWSEVVGFLKQLNLPSGTVISGYPDGQRFRLKITGKVDEGTKQQIRNFLLL